MSLFIVCLAVSLTKEVVGATVTCAHFETSIERRSDHGVRVAFAVNNSCAGDEGDIRSVKVVRGTSKIPSLVCHVPVLNETYTSGMGCSCGKTLRAFCITPKTIISEDETWQFIGSFGTGLIFRTTVRISLNRSEFEDITTNTEEISWRGSFDTTQTPNYVSSQRATTSPSTSTTTSPVTNQPPESRLIITLGSSGCALLFFVGLSIIFHAVMRKRKVGGRSGRLPPPPAPHNVRRAAGEGVMFCVQPPPLPDRHSLVSVQVHDYAEIPDDIDTSSSNKSLTTLDSSSMSDSSMSDDCLHHIACPSSDSSLPEDYLNPVTSTWEAVTTATNSKEAHNSSSSSEAVMYAEERITFKKKKYEKERQMGPDC